jgi:putative ABC transport system substrate-binding protein
MNRRTVISMLGGAAASSPFAARAQQPAKETAMPVIGYLHAGSAAVIPHLVAAFRKGLSDTGYIEGSNVAIEYRWADNQVDRLPELAADLVRRRVAAIAAPGGPAAALAAKAAASATPIVFAIGGDPVQLGLVASLNRPGGNVTGFTGMSSEIAGKQLGLLREMVPGATRFAALVNPSNPNTRSIVADLKEAAAAIGPLQVLAATTHREIDAAFATLVQNRVEALLVGSDALFIGRRVQLAMLAVKHAMPTIFPFREDAEAGGLLSYGSSITDADRQAGIYTGRILKGERPADMPVMRATKFELVINLQSARTLGIEVPATLLAQADEVIE